MIPSRARVQGLSKILEAREDTEKANDNAVAKPVDDHVGVGVSTSVSVMGTFSGLTAHSQSSLIIFGSSPLYLFCIRLSRLIYFTEHDA
jgi:hypothetical protein